VLPACSLEFCPTPGQENVFAVGTYKLEEGNIDTANTSSSPTSSVSPQKRRGECLLLETGDHEDGVPTLSVSPVYR
jgi:hypothetical protein